MSRNLSQGRGSHEPGFLRVFVTLYSSWKTILANAVFFAAYYLLFYELIVRSNAGYFLLTIPYSLLVLIVLASSMQATVAVFYLRLALRRRSLAGVAQSPVGVALGAFVATCSCNLPLIGPLLYFIGLNSLEVSGVLSFLAAYQQAIVWAIVVVDTLSIVYYLRQISRSGFGMTRLADSGRPSAEGAVTAVNNTVNPNH
ncbi:MAG: hypothetical protein OK442_02650 [Thaumarchaeota archaeon]|nr:hypothetical protein [Nitrososphaerota archaeon]